MSEKASSKLYVVSDNGNSVVSGGNEPPGGNVLEPRVTALEKQFEKMDAKLDAIGNDLAYIKGKIEGLPSAQAFGELKGRVDSLTTTTKVAGLLAIAVGAVTLATKWQEFSLLFK